MAANPFAKCGPRRKQTVRAICLAGLIAGLCAGCEKRNTYAPPPPPRVTVATPVQETVTVYQEFPGTTQASQTVNIVPRVLGYVDSIHFADGSDVTKDQLLFVIDPRPYQDAYDVAVAQVAVAKANYVDAKANYARALKENQTAGVISQQDIDLFEAQAKQGQANVDLAQANLANAKLNLDFTHITAPLAGKISRRLVDIGNLVTANTTVLTTINQYDPMYAYFNVSEADFLAYLKRQREAEEQEKSEPSSGSKSAPSKADEAGRAGNAAADDPPPKTTDKEKHPVEMGLSDETGYPHQGTIDFADNQVDPATGTLLIRGVFPNSQPYRVAPGLFVRIRAPIGTQNDALLVPDRALGTDQEGKFLLVVRADHVVEHRAVSVGSLVHDNLRIVERGIKPGEQFIVEGLQFARPGAKVNPVSESDAAKSDEKPK